MSNPTSNRQVKRLTFKWVNGEGDLWDDPNGTLVHYADYVKLEQELLKAMRQRNDEQRLRLAAERSSVETAVARCGWFGEGRGQCLLKEGHRDDHTCEHDGRQLRKAMLGLAAVSEAERRAVKTGCEP